MLAVAVAVLGRAESPGPPPGALVRVDAGANRVVARTPIEGHTENLAVTPGEVWMTDSRGRSVAL